MREPFSSWLFCVVSGGLALSGMGPASAQAGQVKPPGKPVKAAVVAPPVAKPHPTPTRAPVKMPVTIAFVDTTPGTAQLLRAVQFPPIAWQRKLPAPAKPGVAPETVVAVLSALSDADIQALDRFVRSGGRALLLAPDGNGISERLGLIRQAVTLGSTQAVNTRHPIFQGFQAKELDHALGLVGSAPVTAVQRPVTGGWLPLLLAQDTEYSPLLEVRSGRGRLLLCTLELGQGTNPAARRLLRNMIGYLVSPVFARSTKTLYIGPPAGKALLDRLDIRYRPAEHYAPDARLVLIAPEARNGANALIEREFVQRGGRVVVLPTQTASPDLKEQEFGGVTKLPNWPECQGIVPSDLNPGKPTKMMTLASKTAVAGGLLERVGGGTGVTVRTQIDPSVFRTADEPTATHFDRSLSTLLSDMGAAFVSPVMRVGGSTTAPVVKPNPGGTTPTTGTTETTPVAETEIPLRKGWRVRQTVHLKSGDTEKVDPGISLQAKALVSPDGFDEDWDPFDAPANYGGFDVDDGEAVFRITIKVPANWVGKTLEVSLGMLDDNDITFFNGVVVGATEGKTKPRVYTVPSGLVHAGANIIAVRLFDAGGSGGFLGPAESLKLTIKKDQ